jgi:hypothetical protein
MAVSKRVLRPDRLWRVPPQFSWVDHRLVRDGHVSRCSADALALYLVLVTVADSQGLSYYCDATLSRLLPLDAAALGRARQELIANQLIAYARPLYQVLALAASGPSRSQSPAQAPPPSPQPQPSQPRPSSRPSRSRPLSSRRSAGEEQPACPQSIAQIIQRLMENAQP